MGEILSKLISSEILQQEMIFISSILAPEKPLEFWYNTSMLKKKKERRIMVFGTFDGLHKGHLNFFKQAKKLAQKSFLIVSIARDLNVFEIKKRFPAFRENERVILVQKLIKSNLVNKVVLSGIKNYLPHIIKEHPDIIALGYDQKAYTKNLQKDLKNKELIVKVVRLKPFRKKIYKNSLLK